MFSNSSRIRLIALSIALFVIATSPRTASAAEQDGWGACGQIDCNTEQEGLQRRQCYFQGGQPIVCECQC